LPRKVHNANRFTHIQDENLTRRIRIFDADDGSLQDKLNRLTHRHEEPCHIRMRDRQRSAGLQLPLKQRDHRSRRPQHIPEPHDDEACRPLAPRDGVECLNVGFGDTFGRAHDIRWVHGFVCRDLNHAAHIRSPAGIRDNAAAQCICQNAFDRIRFHHRDMLQGRSVENEFGAHLFKQRRHARTVAYIGQNGFAGKLAMRFRKLQIDQVELILRGIDQGYGGRPAPRDLTNQFRSNRAARASDKHPAALHQRCHRLPVERLLRPSQKIFDGDRADLKAIRFDTAAQFGQLWRPCNG